MTKCHLFKLGPNWIKYQHGEWLRNAFPWVKALNSQLLLKNCSLAQKQTTDMYVCKCMNLKNLYYLWMLFSSALTIQLHCIKIKVNCKKHLLLNTTIIDAKICQLQLPLNYPCLLIVCVVGMVNSFFFSFFFLQLKNL